MPKKTIEEFKVEYLQVMDETGKVDTKLMPKLSKEEIIKMYKLMVLTRTMDEKIFLLQRQGRMGTYGLSLGQEASAVGSAMALQEDDWVFPSFREHGVFIVRGFPISQYMLYWAGDERGAKIPEHINMMPPAVPVGTQIPHAVGRAWAMKLRREKAVAVAYFGDGATSRGDFHEGMNFAGVFKLPCVFLCQNNQWAISVPVSRQTSAKTLAQKAIAYGFEGIRVDGNDIFAVYSAVKEAVDKARSGGGPTLIECFTYRIGDHTTSDDQKKYRNQEEVEAWKKKDPIKRLELYMKKKKILTDTEREDTWKAASEKIEQAVKDFENIPKQQPEEMFKHLYAVMPAELDEQMKEMQEIENEKDGNITSDDKSSSKNDDTKTGVAR
ncbi:MAG: pyruvate dehydrogenase (acetyl-transferring) E1 component subunit alpha [Candidatus Aenigmarchaeota archaeon]|nr:pyruvate dehydrogenase (acetyl-transferring) E1 component subunit alpha [Candidatus Aenigmarchaeota archaeon]